MDYMGFPKSLRHSIVHMGRKALKRGFIAHEAMDIDKEQCSRIAVRSRGLGYERLRGGGAWILSRP